MIRGSLIVNGISWETTDDSLREYFGTFGEVVEAVVMKDRNTGRSRGFGLITYSDPSVPDVVVMQHHFLDGRTIVPKKIEPTGTTDDQHVAGQGYGPTQT